MRRNEFAELSAFMAVMEHNSFTRAAAALAVSTPTLSQTIRQLETRLGVRLFNRTTRSVAPTDAGLALHRRLGPALGEVAAAVAAIEPYRDEPSGLLRINLSRTAATLVVAPLIAPFVEAHPAIVLELVVDDGFTDIVAAGFDVGIRLGEFVPRDMVVTRIGPRRRLVVVASPGYVARNGHPASPRDLSAHRCVTWRGISTGELYRWEFRDGGRDIRVAIDGPLVVNDFDVALRAAREGVAIAYLLEDLVSPGIAAGELVPLLEPWSVEFSGFHLYYPGGRLPPRPLRAFIDFIKARNL